MSSPINVQSGGWTDHAKHHRYQILTDDFGATCCKVFVGVLLGLSYSYVYEILRNIALRIYWYFEPKVATTGSENSPLLARDIQDAGGGRGFAGRFHRKIRSGLLSRKDVAWGTLVFLAFFSLFVSWAIATVFSAQVLADRAALLKEKHCGLYEYNDTRAGDEDASRHDVRMALRERRAGEYAQNCYGAKPAASPWTCTLFYNTSIAYDIPKHEKVCPFSDSDLCADGYASGVTFDTGLVDSSVLGINANPTYKFRRKTTCSPLNRQRPYVNSWTNHKTGETGFHYYYGGIHDTHNSSEVITRWTLSTSGDPFDWLAPVYRVNTYASTLEGGDVYQPVPGLSAGENSTLTIIFVSALHIFYNEQSSDHIFPANAEYIFPGESRPFYYDSDPKAKPFACADTTWLCSPNGEECWLPNAPLPPGIKGTPGYWLMKYSLENSNTYDSIKYRLGTALLAQQKVGQARSLKIDDNQWELEAEHLFKTSLARAQFDAFSIASGEDKDEAGYVDFLPDEARGRVCGIYKFHSVRNMNVELARFLVLALIPLPLAFLLSRKWSDVKSWFPHGKKETDSEEAGEDAFEDTSERASEEAGEEADEDQGSSSRKHASHDYGSGNGAIGSSKTDKMQPAGSNARSPSNTTPETANSLPTDDNRPQRAASDTQVMTANQGTSSQSDCSNGNRREKHELNPKDDWEPVLFTLLIEYILKLVVLIVKLPSIVYDWCKGILS